MTEKKFVPTVGSLEYRLAPSTVVAAPPAADVQDGNFDGQNGDQTTADTGAQDQFDGQNGDQTTADTGAQDLSADPADGD